MKLTALQLKELELKDPIKVLCTNSALYEFGSMFAAGIIPVFTQ